MYAKLKFAVVISSAVLLAGCLGGDSGGGSGDQESKAGSTPTPPPSVNLPSVPKHQVSFYDHDGTLLKTQELLNGQSATPPAQPARTGYDFIAWDRYNKEAHEDLHIYALYHKTTDSLTTRPNNCSSAALFTTCQVDGDTIIKVTENWGVATADEGKYRIQGIVNNTLTDPDYADSETDGRVNTSIMVQLSTGEYQAAERCRQYGETWFLPAISQLETIFQHKDQIGGLDANVYWSSTVDKGPFTALRFTDTFFKKAGERENTYSQLFDVRCGRIF